MRKKVSVWIDIDDKEKNKCGKDCTYNKSPAQFTTICFLYNEELKWLGVGQGCLRCKQCLDTVKGAR